MWDNSNPFSYQILLVENDVMMRNDVRAVLKSEGFQVLAAANGHEALELSRRHEGAIELLLCATTIPLVEGVSVAGLIRIQHPNVQVLFLSGGIGQSSSPEPGSFLAKPFQIETLLCPNRRHSRVIRPAHRT